MNYFLIIGLCNIAIGILTGKGKNPARLPKS